MRVCKVKMFNLDFRFEGRTTRKTKVFNLHTTMLTSRFIGVYKKIFEFQDVPPDKHGKKESFMKTPVMLSAERESVVKNHSGNRIIPRSRMFEVSLNRKPKNHRKNHALNERVRP